MGCLVLMMHFVHGPNSRFRGLKGLETDHFRALLEDLLCEREPLTPAQIMAHAQDSAPLPDKGLYLTFDDGTIDHAEEVLPVLNSLGLKGDFYPVTEPLADKRISILEKQRVLQYLAFADYGAFLSALLDTLGADGGPSIAHARPDPDFPDAAKAYRSALDFYTPEERYYRWLRDTQLPPARFAAAIDRLFAAAGYEEASFVRDYYLGPEHVRDLVAQGMGIGGHSHTHADLTRLDETAMRAEVDRCRAVLEDITGAPLTRFAYPFGLHAPAVEAYVRASGWAYAFGTENREVSSADHPYLWPRVDVATWMRQREGAI